MKYSHSICYYFKKYVYDSLFQRIAYYSFYLMLILLCWSNIEALYIPSCFSKSTADNINAIIENLSCGYIVSYITYVATNLLPTITGIRHHRVMLAENARLLYDKALDLLEYLFTVSYSAEDIKINFENFYMYNCEPMGVYHKLKQCYWKEMREHCKNIQTFQKVLENGYNDLFSYEKELLMDLQFSEMWRMIKQLEFQEYLFSSDKWESLAKEFINYLNLSKDIRDSIKEEKTLSKLENDFANKKTNRLTVNILSINNKSFNH